MNCNKIKISAITFLLSVFLTACSNNNIKDDQNYRNSIASKILKSGFQEAKISDPFIREIEKNPKPTLPTKVKSKNKIVEIKNISRILTADMYGTLSQIVFNLGLGKNMVGRDTSTDFKESLNIPKIMKTPHLLNIESVLALKPTIFLTDGSIGNNVFYEQLEDLNIPVVYFDDDRSIKNNSLLIQNVADALGVSKAGKKLVKRTEKEISESQLLIPKEAKKLKFSFLYLRGKSTMLLFGDKLGAGSLINALGAKNASSDLNFKGEYQTITAENLIESNPNLLIVMKQGMDSIGGIEKISEIPGINQTNAGENKRIVEMDQNLLLSFGPNLGRVLYSLVNTIFI